MDEIGQRTADQPFDQQIKPRGHDGDRQRREPDAESQRSQSTGCFAEATMFSRKKSGEVSNSPAANAAGNCPMR